MRIERAEHAVDRPVDHLGGIDLINIILLDQGQDIGERFQIFVGIAFLFVFVGTNRGPAGTEENDQQKYRAFHVAVGKPGERDEGMVLKEDNGASGKQLSKMLVYS